MNKYQIRKFSGLFVLYALIILGIFALQFRNETSISKTFDNLRLHLTSLTNDKNESILKNGFQVNTNGIVLYSNKTTPVKLTYTDGSIVDLEVLNWTQQSDKSFTIDFTKNIHLHFSSSDNDNNLFSISTEFPSDAHRLTIPYKSSGAYTVTDYKTSQAIFNSQNLSYVLAAQNIATNTFSLTETSSLAYYKKYEELKTFSFESIINAPLANNQILQDNITNIKTKILTNYPLQKESITAETIISAWIAEKSVQDNFITAINEIPDSFKEGTARTYLTTPYFNSLESMNKTLDMKIENISFSMLNSLSKQTLEVFELDDFSDFLLIKGDTTSKKILSIPSSMTAFEPTVAQAIGILHVYNELYPTKKYLAQLLDSVIDPCIQKIQSAAILNDTSLTLAENGTSITMLKTVKAGYELLRYGETFERPVLISAGRILINSALAANTNTDLRTLADLYKILCAKTNPFYPHVKVLANNDMGPIWAWTCAQKLTYTSNNNVITINCTFPQGSSHYMIIHGIKQFASIEIYGLKFRTDPRFEWYNSSGYAVDNDKDLLFLKYRQKATTETVKLYY